LYLSEWTKNRELNSTSSKNMNFECGPQVQKGWV